MLLFRKLLSKKFFCNWTLTVKDKCFGDKKKQQKSGKCLKSFTGIGLGIFIYYFKCKLKKGKTINKITIFFSWINWQKSFNYK